mmetsp:Transcript_124042/g.215072  ORF Transcript_124042/g.215072 Transcript_124042/m.215072 type:complete len:92 (+) Transcript_124042:271-546(+)
MEATDSDFINGRDDCLYRESACGMGLTDGEFCSGWVEPVVLTMLGSLHRDDDSDDNSLPSLQPSPAPEARLSSGLEILLMPNLPMPVMLPT